MEKKIESLYIPLLKFIRKRIASNEDAEDIIQNVFLRLAKSDYSKIENVKAWIYTIARNSIIDYYRVNKKVFSETDFPEYEQHENNNEAVAELSCCIENFFDKLPEEYRLIMKLSELENIPQKEIAEKLNINYATVRSKVQWGREKLKRLIEDCCTVLQGGRGSIMDFESNNKCADNC